MILFLNDKVDVSRFQAGCFVGRPLELYLGVVFHALFNVDLQNFAFRLGLGGVALTAALIARGLDLCHHVCERESQKQASKQVSTR